MSSIGLPHTYRIQVKNETGATLLANAIQVKFRRVKFDSSAALDLATENVPYDLGSTITDDSVGNGANQDNSGASDKWLGADVFVEVDMPVSGTDGNPVKIYLQHSTDGGTTYPDNEKGRLLFSIASADGVTIKDSTEI